MYQPSNNLKTIRMFACTPKINANNSIIKKISEVLDYDLLIASICTLVCAIKLQTNFRFTNEFFYDKTKCHL